MVFVAELGDKSQLITMTYALRHRWWVVLSGVGIAAFLVHGLSVTIGHFLGLSLPERPIAFAAAIAFLLFAVWTWRDSRATDDDTEDVRVAEPRFIVFAVVSSFVLAELGDKTMLATVALASDHNWAGVWIGATIGMVAADGVAIAGLVRAVRPVDPVRQRPASAVGGRGGDGHARAHRGGNRAGPVSASQARDRGDRRVDTGFVAGISLNRPWLLSPNRMTVGRRPSCPLRYVARRNLMPVTTHISPVPAANPSFRFAAGSGRGWVQALGGL